MRDRDSWEIRVPEGVREVIGRRLNRLSERCNETLTVASVIGREFTLEQLDRLIDDLNQDMLLDVLEEALRTRLIEELPTSVGLYQFTHALIQETLTDELSLTRRVRLHAQIAQMLEGLWSNDLDAHAAELAHHFEQAETLLGAEKLIKYSALAGERALSMLAFEEALYHFEAALQAKGEQPMDRQKAEILFGLGRAQASNLQIDSAAQNLTLAYEFYEHEGDTRQAFRVASSSQHTATLMSGMNEVLTRCLKIIPENTLEAAQLLAAHAFSLGVYADQYFPSKQEFERALSIAERENQKSLQAKILANRANVEGFHRHWREAFDFGSLAIDIGSNDPIDELRALSWASIACTALGQPKEAEELAVRMLSRAEQLRDHRWLVQALHTNVACVQAQGRWQESITYINMVLQDSGGRAYRWWELQNRLILESELGNFEEAAAIRNRMLGLIEEPWESGVVMAGIAKSSRISGDTDQLDTLRELANNYYNYAESGSVLATVAYHVPVSESLIATIEEKHDAIRPHYDLLSAFSGTLLTSEGLTSADRVLGILASAMQDFDSAQTHFEDALDFCRKAGYRPELAWSLCDYADMLLQRNTDGDRDKAMTLLDESLAISTELGMRPLMERVLSRRDILKA